MGKVRVRLARVAQAATHLCHIFAGQNAQAETRAGHSDDPAETQPHTVHGVDIVGIYRPVFDNGQVIGVVGTFSTMLDIQKKDEFIRKYYVLKTTQAKYLFDNFYGEGRLFKELLDRAHCFAQTDETVLITGESDTCNRTLTAQELGISRSTLWRKLKLLQE